MRPVARRAAGLLAIALLGAAVLVAVLSGTSSASPMRIQITIHYSHYDPSRLTVPHGVPVTFVIVNTDPIDHEWIVGDAALQQRHRTGTEPVHNARPTEITIPALTTRETTVIFDKAGLLQYICHLPKHEDYGMVGWLTVT
jgi:uncharacterized cupredoxin-like copper-binding protein